MVILNLCIHKYQLLMWNTLNMEQRDFVPTIWSDPISHDPCSRLEKQVLQAVQLRMMVYI